MPSVPCCLTVSQGLVHRPAVKHCTITRHRAVTPCVVQAVQVLSTALQRLRSMVHEIVGRINGHYGTLTHVPIHHLDRQLNFHELCALYAITDVALVTSLRDGMNLVSYEYVACQSDNAGEADHCIFPGWSGAKDLSKVQRASQAKNAGEVSVLLLRPASRESACRAPVLCGAGLSYLTTLRGLGGGGCGCIAPSMWLAGAELLVRVCLSLHLVAITRGQAVP